MLSVGLHTWTQMHTTQHNTHTYMSIYTQHTHPHMYKHTRHRRTQHIYTHKVMLCVCVCARACVHTSHTHVCMCVCEHVCVYICFILLQGQVSSTKVSCLLQTFTSVDMIQSLTIHDVKFYLQIQHP